MLRHLNISTGKISVLIIFWVISATVPMKVGRNSLAQQLQKVNENYPSVYLAYDSEGNRKSRCKGEEGEHVILQLHNNTNDYINVSANFGTGLEPTVVGESFKLSDGTSAKTLKSGSEVELCYDVEGIYKQKGYQVPERAKAPSREVPYCSCSYLSNGKDVEYPQNIGFWIRPKEFIKFAVPLKFLSENLKVSTEFNYPWEFKDGRLQHNEPKHRVYFYYFDMPDYLR